MERGSGHNDKLDLWKCVAIYSVIFIHILLPGQIGVAVNCLARFAVPLFFLSAGFFSWRSPPRVLARQTVRTAGLLLFACLALLGLGCAMAKHGGASMGAYLLGRFTWANAASLVLWQLFPLPYSWPLWFLAALLMIYLMWWGLTALLLGRLPHRLLAVLALGLLAVHLVLGEGRSLQGLAVDSVRIRGWTACPSSSWAPGWDRSGSGSRPCGRAGSGWGRRRGPFWRCGSAAARNSWTSMWGRCWPRCA